MKKEFFTFMNKRHEIYIKRKNGVPIEDWTNDKILQTYSFTNVYRELDRVTIWIRENWREPFRDHPNLWFAMCIARQINWPDTLEELGFPDKGWDGKKMGDILDARKERKEKIYTGAYMICAESDPSKEWYSWTKQQYMTRIVLGNVWKDRLKLLALLERPDCTIQAFSEALERFHGWGPFMSYEVATDLRHTRYLQEAPDIKTWANAGPGAKRGLNRIFGRPFAQGLTQAKALEEMQHLLKCSRSTGYWRNSYSHPPLEMRDIEHSLCEFDKYQRVLNGEGRPRSQYKPNR